MSESTDPDQYGVLLYYKYTQIPDLDDLLSFYVSNCGALGLLGRVRLAPHGVNVTVGGKLCSLQKHILAMKSNNLFEGTDFKLASCHQPQHDKVSKECGFTSLSIRIVQELVTLSSHPSLKQPEITNAGAHLSAVEFHSVLESAGRFSDEQTPRENKEIVLLDARNLYETRIGKFDLPNVDTMDPGIRQYSDLPTWIDNNSEKIRGKHVLMYCTGGIRCEMASAYIKSKGAGYENVFQLFGGIQRYLEQFPDGGYFKGKNFVFDHRIAVGSSTNDIMGNCLVCGASFDDYSSRHRCSYCRMLVLVCKKCEPKDTVRVCELCQKQREAHESIPSVEVQKPKVITLQNEQKTVSSDATLSSHLVWRNGSRPPSKLRILCLHGFRQNASSFKGRTASLTKKLKSMAELVFIDAPHELPFIYQPRNTEQHHVKASNQSEVNLTPPFEGCNKRFAWLIDPDFSGSSERSCKVADGSFDPLQYQKQIHGFDQSLAYLKRVFRERGPFDGILGFSQGAAMASAVCARHSNLKGNSHFRFVILCSGFAPPLPELEFVQIDCPSLHIFGGEHGKDRQISNQACKSLASLFNEDCSVIIEHDSGHIIPTRPPYITQIKDFLQQFLQQNLNKFLVPCKI